MPISSRISWPDVVVAVLVLLSCSYGMIKKPSIALGIVTVVMIIFLLKITIFRDEVLLDDAGDGIVEYRKWIVVGRKRYTHHGLNNAKAIIRVVDEYGEGIPTIYNYLLFVDGYKQPLPIGRDIGDKVKNWFKIKYDIDLDVIKE